MDITPDIKDSYVRCIRDNYLSCIPIVHNHRRIVEKQSSTFLEFKKRPLAELAVRSLFLCHFIGFFNIFYFDILQDNKQENKSQYTCRNIACIEIVFHD